MASRSERGQEPLARRLELALAAVLPEYPRIALCVAFSGGLDSTVLLTALAGLRRRPALRAIHIDHGLHASSAASAAHCRIAAERLDVPLVVTPVEVRRGRGVSLESAAREARYAALAAALCAGEVLVTAQHADDQLETVLLQLLRGAGLRGLAAMPAIAPFGRGRIARPLLDVERTELEAWAHERALEWVEDPTNADERLDRNYLRRRVLPLLYARWPGAARVVRRTARHAAEAQRLLDLLGRADVERAAVADALAVTRLRALPDDRRRNALRYWIVQRGHPLPDSRRLGELAGALLAARIDAHPEVCWGDTRALREGNRLVLQWRSEPSRAARARRATVKDVSVRAETPAESRTAQSLDLEWFPRARALELPEGLGRLELALDPHGPIDVDALPEPLTVRLRRGGERLRLTRGGPRRLLKSLLQEAKVPREERARMPLLWSGEQLLAAADLWIDVALRADAGPRRRGRLIWHR